tara:strand:+ start:560 stop:1261 length:702 start_codon:yes stop_codon:yes gene_type:complete
MMIYIFTQRDPFFTDTFLEEFDKYNIPYKVFDFPNFNKGLIFGIKRAILLYGFYGFLKMLYIYVNIKFKRKLSNMIDNQKVKSSEEMASILSQIDEEDVLLSLSAPCRIPVEILKDKTLKINFHCGKLPKYAGMMPIFWQMFNGEKDITITAHHLAKEIDTGKIIKETNIPISGSLFKLSQEAKRKSAQIFKDIVLKDSNLVYVPIPRNDKVALTKFPSKDHIREFKKNNRLI